MANPSLNQTPSSPQAGQTALVREVEGPEAAGPARKTAFIYGARTKTFLSGTPFYLARALETFGRKTNSFDVIDVAPRRAREIPLTYLRWCVSSRTSRTPLFLLSQGYHDRSTRDLAVPANVIPYFIIWGQCIPAGILACRRARPESRIILYNDATLLDLIATFDYAFNTPGRLRDKMLRDEKNGYAAADLITVFHEEVRAHMIRDYDVPPEKISVIGRGVNLDPEMLERPIDQKRSALDHKLHLMVVGRGARRKGIFRLIEAIDTLTPEEQSSLVLTVAGPDKEDLPSRSYVRSLGFMPDHLRSKLAAEMAESDLGVLLSDADSLPGSIWEFLALKVPVWVSKLPCIGTALDGYPAIIEDLSQGTPAVAARLRSFLHDPEVLSQLVTDRTKPIAELTWQGPAQFLGEYIRTGQVPAQP
jgi:glycosyltransferase involved in cell wall biosynthesis